MNGKQTNCKWPLAVGEAKWEQPLKQVHFCALWINVDSDSQNGTKTQDDSIQQGPQLKWKAK